MKVIIRPCIADDLASLEKQLPSGAAQLHRERFSAQQRGECTYLITWVDRRPVAHLTVRWNGSIHDHVRGQFPITPEIGRFQVDGDLRGHGIGSRLLARAEELVVERGYNSVGLAVGVRNAGAIRLYQRAGYQDWSKGVFPSHWLALNDRGEVESRPHEVTYMVKRLAAASTGVGSILVCA